MLANRPGRVVRSGLKVKEWISNRAEGQRKFIETMHFVPCVGYLLGGNVFIYGCCNRPVSSENRFFLTDPQLNNRFHLRF